MKIFFHEFIISNSLDFALDLHKLAQVYGLRFTEFDDKLFKNDNIRDHFRYIFTVCLSISIKSNNFSSHDKRHMNDFCRSKSRFIDLYNQFFSMSLSFKIINTALNTVISPNLLV